MKKIILLCVGFFLSTPTFAESNCFLAKENNNILLSEGACEARQRPFSSFKIPLSLIGFNEGILQDESHPELPFRTGYVDYIDAWKQPHNPTSWIKNSVVWYSHIITKKLGAAKFQDYIKKFDYGNADVSGNVGLTRSWLGGGSLKISAEEQTVFIQKILDRKLPISAKSYDKTKNIIYVDELTDGWKLYGKTGTGYLPKADGTLDEKRHGGWFVGWIEKDKRSIVFASYIEQDQQDMPAGLRAKEIAKEKLVRLVNGD
jgi:beta-lactamase class D